MRGVALVSAIALALLAVRPAAVAADRPAGPSSGEAPVLFSADEVQYDDELGLVVAKGHVEISQRDQILLADTVTYNQRTDTVTASGHVTLLQPSGDIVFADFAELHDNLRDGFIKDVRLLLSDRSRMAGNTARRIGGTRTEIRRGVYSPCDLCRDDPTRPPLWQLKAEQIVHDKELKIVEYHDATLEIAGFPVFYTPYLSHPDPSVKRQSGFLAPSFGNSNLNGFSAAVPYYWVIDTDKDVTFRPIFTSTGGTVLGSEYRQRFGFGRTQLNGSVAFGSNSQSSTGSPPPSGAGLRGHLFGIGDFDLNENWRTGFDIQRISDPTYLLRYHFTSPTNFATTHLYAEDFDERSYGNLSAYAFQSLRQGVGDSMQPIVAPVADYTWATLPDASGGRWRFNGNVFNLFRLKGTDTRRLSGGTEWSRPFEGAVGDRFTFTASLRSDGYYSDNLPVDSTGSRNALAGRVFPQTALNWRYPWVRRGDHDSELIEPLAALVVAPNGGNPGDIPNEDSQGFEYDETSLFRRNRFPGYDRVDSGQRVDYGLRAGIYGESGMSSHLLVGQSYRAQQNSAFLPGSGLEHRLSDVVGRVVVTPSYLLDVIYRFRLDRSSLTVRRQEVAVNTGPNNARLTLSYTDFNSIPGVPTAQKQAQISGTLNLNLTRYWSAQVTDTQTVAGPGGSIASGVALTYRDECLDFTASLTQSGIRNADIRPGLSVLFTVVFKNLGELGLRAISTGGT